MNIRGLLSQVKEQRQNLGMSQMVLAQKAGVSLPTIQNIESGNANPSLEVLGAVLEILGLQVTIQRLATSDESWYKLAQIGVPIVPLEKKIGRKLALSEEILLKEFSASLPGFLNENAWSEREREAFAASLLAIKQHYPKTARKLEKQFKKLNIDGLIKQFSLGRLIKLRRIALARFAKYL